MGKRGTRIPSDSQSRSRNSSRNNSHRNTETLNLKRNVDSENANFSVLAGDNDEDNVVTRFNNNNDNDNDNDSNTASSPSKSRFKNGHKSSVGFLFGIFPFEYEKRISGWKRRLFAKVVLGPVIGVILTLAFLYHSVDPKQLEFYRFIQESSFQLPDIWDLPPFLQLDTFSPFMNKDAINNIVGFLNRMAQFEKSEHEQHMENDGPGEQYRKKGAIAHHPVVIVPGIVSTGLELWKGKSCSDGYWFKIITPIP